MKLRSFRIRGLLRRIAGMRRRVLPPPLVPGTELRKFQAELDPGRRTLPAEPPGSLAIVVPCYGHAAYLPEALASIAAQTRQPDEVIFVDDCSPDDSASIARAFVENRRWSPDGRGVLLVNDRNLGQAASLNRAIAAARSDLVMILNDDDYLMHDAVEAMFGFFARYPGVALVGAHSIHFEGTEALAAAPKLSRAYAPAGVPLTVHGPERVGRYRHVNDLNMTHSASTFYRVAAQVVGGYREKSLRWVPFSDRDFQIRMNAVWPVAVAYATPLSFWRTDSSVDRYANS
jgi:glycosyltransferase involved in cell wall biosynthesis